MRKEHGNAYRYKELDASHIADGSWKAAAGPRPGHPGYDIRCTINYKGGVSDEDLCDCIASFPGRQGTAWDALVRSGDYKSVACVFLPDVQSGLGQHAPDPENPGKCYCHTIYGERDFRALGYLRYMKRKHTKLEKQRVCHHAIATNAVVVDASAPEAVLSEKKTEAEKRWLESGKVASWGCAWFHQWKLNIGKAVDEHSQQLVVVYLPGQKGRGKVEWNKLTTFDDLWDGVGLGGSQKIEVAYLDRMRKEHGNGYRYKELDANHIADGSWKQRSTFGGSLKASGNMWKESLGLKTFDTSSAFKASTASSGPKQAWAGGNTKPTLLRAESTDPDPMSNPFSFVASKIDFTPWRQDDDDNDKEEEKNSEGEFDDVDSLYSDWSDLGDMAVNPFKWPWFVIVWIILTGLPWIIFKIKDGGFVAGLESIFPGWTELRLTNTRLTSPEGNCTDYRWQIWRALTYQFTHAGPTHIGMNTLMLFFLGMPLECFQGHFKLAWMFNFGVLGGAFFYVLTDPHGPALVGMSGGCYSLLGIHMSDIVMNWDEKELPRKKLTFLVIVGVLDLVNVELSSDSEAAASPSHWAHLGGWIFGLLTGLIWGRNVKFRSWEKWIWIVAVLTLVSFIIFSLSWSMTWPPRNVFDQEPWCWSRQVMNWTQFGNHKYHCVRCSNAPCIARWGKEDYVANVSKGTCAKYGGWAFTNFPN
mmetsp:Transcript_109111/g.348325  ORF Transcript_109111/g.348325 Transcript_109111/m.348325 type:complete len:699 (-) Transcript_109111:259-2355(-)